MTDPKTALESIKTALKQSKRLPSRTSYSTFELDTDGGQSNVRPPVVEITPIDTVVSQPHNTDFVGYVEDDNGNRIGRKYHTLFEMPVQIDVWTTEGDQYSPKDIGTSVRYALYEYDDYKVGNSLPDPASPSTSLSDVDYFTVGDGQVANDLTMSPALRRWRQTAEIWFHEELNTVEEYGAYDYVESVQTPSDGDATSSDGITITLSPQ